LLKSSADLSTRCIICSLTTSISTGAPDSPGRRPLESFRCRPVYFVRRITNARYRVVSE
jgi:hypothetical protein